MKFYTDSKKRIRPISQRQTSIGTYQTGTAHLSVPKRITKSSNLESLVNNQSHLYAQKLGLKTPFQIKINNSQSRLARVRATRSNGIVSTVLEVNAKQYEKCHAVDPEATDKFLDYAMGHELAHLKQYEDYGFTGAGAMPKWLMEEKADREAFRLTGITEKEIESIITQINTKLNKQKTTSISPNTPLNSQTANIPQNWASLPKRNGQITFIKKNGQGAVSIQEIPDVDVNTILTTGYTYYIKSSKTKQTPKFKTYNEALNYAVTKMEEQN